MRVGLACFLVLLAACGPSTTGPAAGEERGPCYGNGTCNAGLTCLSAVCVSTATDGGGGDAGVPGADAGPAGCEGTFAPGTLVYPADMRAYSPAVTADELSMFYWTDTGQVWEATRASTTAMFSAHRAIPELSAPCAGMNVTGVDVSADGLRVYVACGGLYQLHRVTRATSSAFVSDGMVADEAIAAAVVADELELYGASVVGGLFHASRATSSAHFGAPLPVTSLASEGELTAPDLSPDGLTLYASIPRTPGSTQRALVAYTRTSLGGVFDPATRTMLGVEGSLNAGSPEVAPSCRSLYYSALDASNVNVYVARR